MITLLTKVKIVAKQINFIYLLFLIKNNNIIKKREIRPCGWGKWQTPTSLLLKKEKSGWGKEKRANFFIKGKRKLQNDRNNKYKKKKSSPHLTREPLSLALVDKKKRLCLSGTLINSL